MRSMWVGKNGKNSGARALWCGRGPALAAGAEARSGVGEARHWRRAQVQRGRRPGLGVCLGPCFEAGGGRGQTARTTRRVQGFFIAGRDAAGKNLFSSLPITHDYSIGPQ